MPELSPYPVMNDILMRIVHASSVSEIDTLVPELKLEIDRILNQE